MPKKKKQKPQWLINIEYWLFLMLYNTIRKMELKTAYKLAGALVKVLYVFDFKHRSRTINHLLHAGVCKTRKEAIAMAKVNFNEFAKLLVEIVKIDQVYHYEGYEVEGDEDTIRDVINPKTRKYPTHILATNHYGNWEVAARLYSTYNQLKLVSIYREFDNPRIGKLILEHRACEGKHDLVSKDLGIRSALRAIKEGHIFTILVDQHASHKEGVENVFFGHPCRTHMTPALLHLKTRLPIVPVITKRMPGDTFTFHTIVGKYIMYEPTGDKEHDVREISQMITTEFEKLIAAQPEQWLWCARRWLDCDDRHR